MSFSAFAHRVRDPARSHRRRVSALRSCVQLYRPIGFEAGLSYLREVAGPYEHDEAALARALDALTASRQGWHAHQRRYDAERRAAKRIGDRSPRRRTQNPYLGPAVWYGAVAPAALHALSFWQSRRLPALVSTRDPLAARLDVLTATCLRSDGDLSTSAQESLDLIAAALHDRLGSEPDAATYSRTRNLLFLAHLIRTSRGGS